MSPSVLAAAAIALAVLVPVAASAQSKVSITVANQTGYTMTAIYAGPSWDNDWGPNILDRATRSGESVLITLDTAYGGCEFDLRYDFSDGDSFEEFQVDVCAINGQDYVLE